MNSFLFQMRWSLIVDDSLFIDSKNSYDHLNVLVSIFGFLNFFFSKKKTYTFHPRLPIRWISIDGHKVVIKEIDNK